MTPWTIQSVEFSRPEYWSGLPFPSPVDLPDPGIELGSPLKANSLPAEPLGKSKRKRKKSTDAMFFFLNVSNKEEGRKLGSKENNLTNGFHGMTGPKAFDSVRDHPLDLIRDHVPSLLLLLIRKQRPEE